MMSSDQQAIAQRILGQMALSLDEQTLSRQIDEPILAAAEAFCFEGFVPYSAPSFHGAIGGFVRHIYEHGLSPAQVLSEPQSLAEAIALLESAYAGPNARGYYAAFLDAAQSTPAGLETVLARMAMFMISIQRQKHTACALAKILMPLDWTTRCLLVRFLLERFGDQLTPQLRQCDPAQLVDQIPDLLTCGLAADHLPQQIGTPVFCS
jgi:hypothetical protein